ncbi:MAG: hypothetical protein EWV81_13120 [Microcystis aeruginosa Ma_SC_T_19800800_S464]|uniref:Uncharacterized protein n=1 Tax=Microcystis aeruginosa Ma_SC_T_19800800_S464 TaxID=2486257 RepID=A0A552DRU7_MICAE|nr:MAG: hypothetical protein EWV81_13120 [Microcystis aeruginosa Ma_SC_T_19800800_S464]
MLNKSVGGVRSQETGVSIQESVFRSQYSGVSIQESVFRSQYSGVRRLFLFVLPIPQFIIHNSPSPHLPITPLPHHPTSHTPHPNS